tara:strand:+ start:7430 stop:8710 length:1281 start_codon:yes stop_codon:yes gene_type:complete
MMREDFLHYIWKFQLFNSNDLFSQEGEIVQVLKPGVHNVNAGPDFFNGQVILDKTRWAGNIEIHLKSSDWKQHNHQHDDAYDKVILHVVWENDESIRRENGEIIPTIELKGRVKLDLLNRYEDLQKSQFWVPCQDAISQVKKSTIAHQMDRAVIERLEDKSKKVEQLLQFYKNDWEQTLYHLLCKYFGFKVNAVPFELLANALPYQIIRKHQSNLFELEALLFGQAGLLDLEFEEDYPKRLQKQYVFLKSKYNLKSIEPSLWKFSKLRPPNFPTIRIAQLATLLFNSSGFFQTLIQTNAYNELFDLIKVQASTYWNNHFTLDKLSKQNRLKELGNQSVDMLIINVLCPLLIAYAHETANEIHKQNAIDLLEQVSSEKNIIIRKWKELGIESNSAYDSQALIQQKLNYCDLKKCLTCMIGSEILMKS